MAVINTLSNTASITYGGNTITSTPAVTAVTPTITGSTLTYTIPSIPALGTETITFQVTVVGGTT